MGLFTKQEKATIARLAAELDECRQENADEIANHEHFVNHLRRAHEAEMAELRRKHEADTAALHSKLAERELAYSLEEASQRAKIEMLTSKGARYEQLVSQHELHIGGRHDIHGRGVQVKYECPCGFSVYAPEGFF